MSHALTIEPSSVVTGGFGQECPVISGISEGANISGTLLNKLGTSIPTPFARLHLFNSAFKEVNAANGAFAPTAGDNYNKLVSLALDMLEFLYLYGASSSLSIFRWNINQEVAALKSSSIKGHQDLGDALLNAWNDGNYPGQEIYLFKYKDDIIGGTSPLSMFYTNPNLAKTFKGLSNNHKLFDSNDPVPLADREREFRLYLYKLHACYSQAFSGTEIGQYISRQLTADRADDIQLNNELNSFQFLDPSAMQTEMEMGSIGGTPYIRLNLNASPLNIAFQNGNGLEMWVKDLANISFQSDYHIAPTVETYKEYIENGAHKKLRTPLVLNKNGLNTAKYVNNSFWSGQSLPDGDLSVPLQYRKLPSTEISYPYLRAEDFLQDNIIQVSYNIYKDRFYTGLEEDTNFLLPLKREFFKYFRPEDLAKMYKIETLTSPDFKIKEVKVTLQIPLKGGRTIPLEKTYSVEDKNIIDAKPTTQTFNLSFFPFYIDEAPGVRNEYDVLLVSSIDNARLNFYKLENPDDSFQPITQGAAGRQGEIISNIRTEKDGNNSSQSIHYHINRAFDIVEVSLDSDSKSVAGLILPKVKRINTSVPTNQYVFGVDFGTTNTQIAFACNNGSIESFHINVDEDSEDLQTIYLNNHGINNGRHLIDAGFGSFSDIASMSRREFVTSEMAPSLFPIRSAICEVSSLDTVQHPRLFGHLNIGFNYTKELISDAGANRYVTDLKWDTTDLNAKDRMKAFFKELLLLMRNKSILNKGRRDIKVAVTYPQAMNGRVESDLRNAWAEAAEEIDLHPDNIDFHYESIAPYYSFSRRQTLTDTYVNMDIGGGSTDILYLNPSSEERMTFSVKFAGDDIWGDGYNQLLEGGNNGFIRLYEASDRFKHLDSGLVNNYATVKRNSAQSSSGAMTQRSSDIIDYLFKNDKDYHFTEEIKNSRMILLPILHFTSLIYYMVHIVESQDLSSIPRRLSFTGMGSLYLKMLGSQKELSALAQSIIDFQTQKEGSKIEIILAPNPKKVTAEGAVTISLAESRGIEIINTETGLSLGIEDEEPDTRLNIQNIRERQIKGENLSEKILVHYRNIAKLMLENERYRETLSNMGFDSALNSIPSKDQLMSIFENSYHNCEQKFQREHQADPDTNRLRESLFFWPLKNGLYDLGELLSQAIHSNQ